MKHEVAIERGIRREVEGPMMDGDLPIGVLSHVYLR
jgi:hypothetical protein